MKLSSLSKTVFAALAITFTLNVVTPRKAEAGVVLYVIGRTNDQLTDEGRKNLQVWGIIFMVVGCFSSWHWFALDNEENQSFLAKQLKSQYPVLADQPHVANKLANALSKKAAELFKTDSTSRAINTTLPSAQLDGILAEAIVTDENAGQLNLIREQLTK
jgi:hypothetical protein